MKISTKGRYALRIMVELALNEGGDNLPIRVIAERQGISEKYSEQIVNVLNRSGFVRSSRGSQGGYRLAKVAKDCTVGMILRAIEGDLAPVACLAGDVNDCPRREECVTLDVWQQVEDAINNVLDNITLADLALKQKEKRMAAKR